MIIKENQGSTEKRIQLSAEEKRLIDQLLLSHETTRTSLSVSLGVSPAWVTKTITPLINNKIITETGAAAISGGRRARTLGLSHEIGYLAGIDFGVGSLELALATSDKDCIVKENAALDIREGPEICLKTLFEMIEALMHENGIKKELVRGIGVGVPGPVNFPHGRLISTPLMPGWEDYPLAETLIKRFPEAFVMIDNDVSLMTQGEFYCGTAKSTPNFIFLYIGTEIGAGVVCEGRLYRGSSGCAGDVGHIVLERDGPLCYCGNRGCIEMLASTRAITDQARKVAESGQRSLLAEGYNSNTEHLTVKDVGAAAAQGDLAALELIDRSGKYVGEMLTHLVRFYNPNLVLIGGDLSHIGHRFLNTIKQVILKQASPLATRSLRIEFSSLGDQAGILGALSMVQRNLFFVPYGESN